MTKLNKRHYHVIMKLTHDTHTNNKSQKILRIDTCMYGHDVNVNLAKMT